MRKIILTSLLLSPVALLASGNGTETDIVPRTVNFLIFFGIVYYLLADKIKFFLKERTQSIQGELDKVQATLEESKQKVADAEAELEKAKRIAEELVSDAKSSLQDIEKNILAGYESEIKHLNKTFDEKLELATNKAKKETVKEVLDELLNNENLAVSKENLSEIISKKVA